MRAPFLSVVVPVFNEEHGIAACAQRLTSFLDGAGVPWEIVIADDGSDDGTAAAASAIAARDPRVRLSPGPHRGKGAAVRRGMLAATGEWRFMADADLSMPPAEITRFLQLVRGGQPPVHVVVGSREAIGARRIGEPWRRHAIGRVFNRVVQTVVLPGIDDTQCGFKLFSAEAAEACFGPLETFRFGFDAEVLVRAHRRGWEIAEVPVRWRHVEESRVGGIGDAMRMLYDLVRLRFRRL